MFNKIVFSNYYLRKRRDLKKDGKASVELSKKPAEVQKEIIGKVGKKEVPNIKIALKEIEEKEIFGEIKEELDEEQEKDYNEIEEQENGKEYSSPYYLAEKIFDIINNYKKEYVTSIWNSLKIH